MFPRDGTSRCPFVPGQKKILSRCLLACLVANVYLPKSSEHLLDFIVVHDRAIRVEFGQPRTIMNQTDLYFKNKDSSIFILISNIDSKLEIRNQSVSDSMVTQGEWLVVKRCQLCLQNTSAAQSDIGKQQWVTGFHCVYEVL